MTSLPDSAIGRVMAWIGNGVRMPASASASAISLRIPKSANDWVGSGSSSVTVIWADVLSSSAASAAAGGKSAAALSLTLSAAALVLSVAVVLSVGGVLSVEGSGDSWLPSDCSQPLTRTPSEEPQRGCGG